MQVVLTSVVLIEAAESCSSAAQRIASWDVAGLATQVSVVVPSTHVSMVAPNLAASLTAWSNVLFTFQARATVKIPKRRRSSSGVRMANSMRLAPCSESGLPIRTSMLLLAQLPWIAPSHYSIPQQG